MENTIKSFTTEQLIAELKTRNYRTDLIFGLDDIAAAMCEEEEIPDEELMKVLNSVDTEQVWAALTDAIGDQVNWFTFND
jgi:hypothetical protein